MNYRHAFHAGNFADVVKHAVLARILVHLAEKPAAFRVIDTHAGAGLYDLAGTEANRTGEWRDGIGRLAAANLAQPIRGLIAPYLHVVASFNRGASGSGNYDASNRDTSDSGTSIVTYPGSPALALALLRPQDRLVACELEPGTARALAHNLGGDARAKVVAIDGWTALKAYVPPKERRGLVLIDPAFEQPDEFTRLADALAAAHRKWPTGIYQLWYPIKDRREPDALARRLAESGLPKLLRVEVAVAPADSERLAGSGLVIVNPPWTLESELKNLLPALVSILAREGKGGVRIDWLAREK